MVASIVAAALLAGIAQADKLHLLDAPGFCVGPEGFPNGSFVTLQPCEVALTDIQLYYWPDGSTYWQFPNVIGRNATGRVLEFVNSESRPQIYDYDQRNNNQLFENHQLYGYSKIVHGDMCLEATVTNRQPDALRWSPCDDNELFQLFDFL